MSTATRHEQRRGEGSSAPGVGLPRRISDRPRVSRRREAGAVILLLLLAAAVRLPTLDQALVERHAFRQTQTAYTALLFHESGVDLQHPKLPVFGTPFEVPFELPLVQAMAAAVMSWGLSPDVAVRTTGLACFLLSALLLWGLVRHVGGRLAAIVTLALFLFSPFSLLWSRALLIEYLAVAGAVGWVWAGVLWRDRRRAVYAGLALIAGLVAMLVKPTTGALWVLPLLAYTAVDEGPGWRSWLRARRDIVLAVVIVAPCAAALAWTNHADAVKAASDATRWLTSSRLTEWNFGTVGQRLDGSNWTTIMDRIRTELTGYPAWLLPLAALVGLRSRQARFWAALVAVPILTIVIFWNLYVVHDYYLAAISPVLAAVAGFGVARVWHAIDRPRARRLLVALLGAYAAALLVLEPSLATLAYRDTDLDDGFPVGSEAHRLTEPTDLVVFEGSDWAPVVPYYARRAGYMIGADPDEQVTPDALAKDGYKVLVTSRLESDLAADTIRAGRWTGVLGHSVYITGDRHEDLRDAPIAAPDDLTAAGTPLLAAPVTITCGRGGTVLPRGEGATVLHLAAGTPRTAKLSVAAGYGEVPVRHHVVLAPDLGAGPVTVDCRDAATVTIVGVDSVHLGA